MAPPADPPPAAPPPRERTFLGHPVGLYVLFLTQMWERFSYFGMLDMLIFYLKKDFRLPQAEASNIIKWYTSVIFLTPLLGGFLADRYLGNKRSVVLGALMMAVGHLLMAIPTLTAVFVAMVFLVLGFGFLTPPLTSQVGLLYAPGDARRDSAYTIFYMGINLGASIAPIICTWLVEHTRGGFHSGLTVPAFGMMIAVVTYLFGSRWVIMVDQGAGTLEGPASPNAASASEQRAEQTPSVSPLLNRFAPVILLGLGGLLAVVAPVLGLTNLVSWSNVFGLEVAAVAAGVFAWITGSVRQGVRDRVLAILLLFFFAVVYWAGAGQYPNTINLWADQNTNRYLTQDLQEPSIFPEAAETTDAGEEDSEPAGLLQRWLNMFKLKTQKVDDSSWIDPVPAMWFQSVNPVMILILAPLFAMLWTRLDRVGWNPSTPVKMALGLLFMTLAFVLMVMGAWREAQPSSVTLQGELPGPLVVNDHGQVCKAEEGKARPPYAAGRLFYDAVGGRLRAVGVFPDSLRDEIVGDTAPADFVGKIKELQTKAAKAAAGPQGWKVQVQLDRPLSHLDLQYYAGKDAVTGNQAIRYDPDTQTLTATIELGEKESKGLKVSAGDSNLRASLDALVLKADASRVSPWWLIGFFLLATMGELCLTPVGLSMVSQLAPARFASMLMGLWLLTWTFANFIAGAFGEEWGTLPPLTFFLIILAFTGGAMIVLFAISRKIGSLMHEGK